MKDLYQIPNIKKKQAIPLTEIAEAVGFSNQNYFTKVFNKSTVPEPAFDLVCDSYWTVMEIRGD